MIPSGEAHLSMPEQSQIKHHWALLRLSRLSSDSECVSCRLVGDRRGGGRLGRVISIILRRGLKRIIYRFGSRMGNKSSQLSKKNLALLARNADMDENQVEKTVYSSTKSYLQHLRNRMFFGKTTPSHSPPTFGKFYCRFYQKIPQIPEIPKNGIQIHKEQL